MLDDIEEGRTINMESIDNTIMLTTLKIGQIQGMNQLLRTKFSEGEEQ